jgi:hypothetical protein
MPARTRAQRTATVPVLRVAAAAPGPTPREVATALDPDLPPATRWLRRRRQAPTSELRRRQRQRQARHRGGLGGVSPADPGDAAAWAMDPATRRLGRWIRRRGGFGVGRRHVGWRRRFPGVRRRRRFLEWCGWIVFVGSLPPES